MDDKALKDLLSKYRQGTCTEEELALLENWVSVTTYSEYVISEKELQEDFDLVAKALPLVKPKVIKLWPRIAAVAAAVAMVVFGVWFFNYRGEILRDALDDKSVVVNDIAPGKNGATITLGNGKVIELSDAKSGVVIGDDKLAYNDGSEIDNSSLSRSDISPRGGESSAGAKDMTASTTKGQTYIFTLPDGTKVWLNAASTLTIPSDFSGTETRKVELTGEAYFEVAKSYTSLRGRRTKQSFVVESNGQQVEVLGTHFNINTFEQLHMGSGARTTLLEGSVKVTADGKSMVLQPGKMAYNSPDGLRVLEADVEQAVAWKNGYFSFKGESIQNIMQIISRWYDIEVSYQGNVTKDGFNGKISRFKNISQVLKMLEDTKLVHFKVEGRRVTVKE